MATLVQQEVLWEVADNFQKQTYRNRYHICTDRGLHKLSIPIQHVGGTDGRQRYREVRIDNYYQWQKQHWRTLQTAYRSSPFFEYYEDGLAPLFHMPYSYLLDFNWATLSFVCEALEIELPNKKTTQFLPNYKEGVDARFLANAKQQLPFAQEKYLQVFEDRHGFVQNTSTLDLIFNEGSAASGYLQRQSLDFLATDN